MKLGFWNRLAIVAGVIFTITAPTWLILSQNYEMSKARMAGYKTCTAAVGTGDGSITWDFCRASWLDGEYRLGWTEWWQAVLATAAIALVVYGLIAGIVFTAKWVWRGRSISTP